MIVIEKQLSLEPVICVDELKSSHKLACVCNGDSVYLLGKDCDAKYQWFCEDQVMYNSGFSAYNSVNKAIIGAIRWGAEVHAFNTHKERTKWAETI